MVNSLLKAVYKGDFLYFSFYAFATIMFLYVGLKKLKINLVFVMLLYYCLFYFAFTFNAMRQALAMAMFVYSLNFLIKGKVKEYFLLNILAMCFHVSSIVYIFFGAIWFFDISKKHFVFSIFLPLITLFIYISGLGYEVFSFFTSALGKPSTYLSEWKEEISVNQWASRIVMLIAISFFTLKHQENKLISSLGFFYIIGFSLYILFADVAMLSSRLNMAFRIVEIIIAGLLLIEYRTISNKFFVFLVFMIPYSIQFLINASNPDNQYILRSAF
ncbi:EpsG family protein [Modicisalibacter muralis]|uniref:EpsG family protein n=2 Tax=Modicisalibacter muralis TaxID=119000 RepID=A0A1G9EUC8_9GAMM|nr:EpsG family protein [Halomonas muralis]